MSFSSETKAELCRVKTEKPCCVLAQCYGILLYCSTFSSTEIRISTASPDFAALLPKLFGRAFGLGFDTLPHEGTGGRRSFIINDRQKISLIFDRFGLDAESSLAHHINLAVLEEGCCKTAFLRGAFLPGAA